MTGWTLADFTRAARRTADSWSPQADALADPAATRCGLAGQVDVLDPRASRSLPAAGPSTGGDGDAFVPGASFPASPPPPEVPAGTPTWGSFLVPEPGTTADARMGTFTTDWFRLPAADDVGVGVAVSGRTGEDVSLRVEYGRRTPDGFAPLAGGPLGGTAESLDWRSVSLVGEVAPPAGADVVRLVATDTSTTTGGWLAFTADRASLGAAAGVLPSRRPRRWPGRCRTFFPCVRQPRQQAGVTEPAVGAIGFGRTLDEALDDWTFDATRGGVLGHAEREGPGTLLTIRVRDVAAEVRDLWVLDLRPPYPTDGYALTRERRTVSGMPEEGVDLSLPAPPADG